MKPLDETPLAPDERARIEAAVESITFLRLLGISLGGLGRGRATFHLEARPELLQNKGLLHGGALASLLDTAAAFAVVTLLEPAQTTATADLTIPYVRPIRHGKVTAEARVLRAGRRLASLAVEVTDAEGRLAATALTTYVIIS